MICEHDGCDNEGHDCEMIKGTTPERYCTEHRPLHGYCASCGASLIAHPSNMADLCAACLDVAGDTAAWKEFESACRVATPAWPPTFQSHVKTWLDACFGPEIAGDRVERNHRFIEEALELVQATGCSRDDCHCLVDYVYSRPSGDPAQEVGGVMTTLAALCLANGMDMDAAAKAELARVWAKIATIRAKQAAKPKGSPLPVLSPLDRDMQMHIAVTDEERAAIESALKRFPQQRSVGPYEGGALAAICRWWELAQLHPLDPNANHPPHLSGDELLERLMRAVGEGDGAKS